MTKRSIFFLEFLTVWGSQNSCFAPTPFPVLGEPASYYCTTITMKLGVGVVRLWVSRKKYHNFEFLVKNFIANDLFYNSSSLSQTALTSGQYSSSDLLMLRNGGIKKKYQQVLFRGGINV